jgi:hypothetical protein
MGTRAVIRVNGKPMIATHWDGYPESLGSDLKNLKTKNLSSIIRIAKKHTIDFVDSSVRERLNKERLERLSKKHDLPLSKIKQGYRRGNIIGAEDYEIGSIKGYSDFAEYEYDVDTKTGKIKVRPLRGEYRENNPRAGKWKQLSKVI